MERPGYGGAPARQRRPGVVGERSNDRGRTVNEIPPTPRVPSSCWIGHLRPGSAYGKDRLLSSIALARETPAVPLDAALRSGDPRRAGTAQERSCRRVNASR